MIKIYALLIVLGLLGGVGYAGYSYYTSTQQKIQTLTANNARLETAAKISEESVVALQQEAFANAKRTIELQEKLQQAEAYGDNLRKKLRELDLLSDAIKKPKDLEGRMNGATAKLWRELEDDTGGDGSSKPLPNWLQRDTDSGDADNNQSGKDDGTTRSSPQAN